MWGDSVSSRSNRIHWWRPVCSRVRMEILYPGLYSQYRINQRRTSSIYRRGGNHAQPRRPDNLEIRTRKWSGSYQKGWPPHHVQQAALLLMPRGWWSILPSGASSWTKPLAMESNASCLVAILARGNKGIHLRFRFPMVCSLHRSKLCHVIRPHREINLFIPRHLDDIGGQQPRLWPASSTSIMDVWSYGAL